MAGTKGKRTPPASQQRSSVRRVADALRRDALDRGEGELLGSEDDLILRYGVSRPTLRQAAALVVQENLLVVKRGVGGGYFVRRPDSKAVAHVAAVYLRSRKTRVEEIIRAVAPIRIEIAKLAARNTDPELKGRLRRFLEVEEQREQVSFGEFVRAEREFARLMSDLSGNRVIALFLEILYDCSALLSPEEDLFRNHHDRVDEYRAKRNRLAAALLDGDEEIAVVAAARLASTAAEWMMQDLEGRAPRERLIAIPGLGDEAATATNKRASRG
jgi:DNA-binding FadR family transcriptional regulator